MQFNIKRVVTSFCIIVVVLIATGNFAIRPANAAGVWYVKNGGNDGSDCQTPATACANINAALAKPGFVAGDTIRVAVGTYTGTGSEVVLINKDATLSGGWDAATFTTQSGMATIDGQGGRKGVTVSGTITVSIQSFVFQNGVDANNMNRAGGINSEGSNLVVANSRIINNTSGGIFHNGMLVLSNSTVSGNSAAHAGGGILVYGDTTVLSSTISSNTGNGYPGGGGGINVVIGNLTIRDSAIISNTATGGSGGGIAYDGNGLVIDNSTISGNSAVGNGGGVYVGFGYVTISSSTIANNNSTNPYYGSGGLYYHDLSGSVIVKNTIIAGNQANASPDCESPLAIQSDGYNILGNSVNCNWVKGTGDKVGINPINPMLNPLQDNGGPTWTHSLQPGSPAIEAGNPAGCNSGSGMLATDQRGYPRIGRCDIGAYEMQGLKLSSGPVFIPIVIRDPSSSFSGLNGYVTYNGDPIGNIPLLLRFYNGSAWSTLASTITASDGRYFFPNVPGLASGQKYYVRFLNSVNPGLLSSWSTRVVTSYTPNGSIISTGNFDIADIPLESPPHGTSTSLPTWFQWTRRLATPTDNYELDLFDPTDGVPWWWTGPLGYVNQFPLGSLPAGFSGYAQYGWYVAVYSPDGGYGESYYYRLISFSGVNNPVLKVPLHPKSTIEDLPRTKVPARR